MNPSVGAVRSWPPLYVIARYGVVLPLVLARSSKVPDVVYLAPIPTVPVFVTAFTM